MAAPPQSAPSAVAAAAPITVVIRSIPPSLHAADLRRIFSHFVEHLGFGVFHYRHRPEVIEGTSTGANVGFAQVPTTKELKQLLADYQYRRWQDTDAKALTAAEAAKAQPATCIIIERVPDDALPAMKQYPELHPPDILPRGNVGTPIHEITALIRECRLPTRLIRQLQLDFPSGKRRLYGRAPLEYESTKDRRLPPAAAAAAAARQAEMAKAQEAKPAPLRRTLRRLAQQTGQGIDAAAPMEDLMARRAAQGDTEPLTNETVPSGEDDDGNDDALTSRTAEEWDRHMALHVDDEDDRAKDRLFEKEVEQVWDKGDASGLVTYTDAQYWDAMKDGFEGDTADDWNVDMSAYYGEDPEDRDSRDWRQLRREGYMNMVGERGRRHDPTAGQTDASFEAYTKGVGSRILKQQGWRRGQPIGRRAGLLEPLEAEGNDPGDRRGIGYRGPRDDSAGRDDRERWRATSTVWYDETGRRHVRLSAEEAAAQAAAAPPKKKAHIIGTAFD